ncbi:hypothetical protein C731_3972 [Mycolicibacterium hassiacum DSM 44199]|uniref:Uncharacterized protein n=1 Tax=Mycolicibacterium hassiacum (strain DSM 44199 / CIP 105218 / JCM 12690 / 3849) TaxID=1122247 RepID=K5BIX0_MYCHD|nr:hypothetical protein C731_3972 [Mycolicibacterium hassiacum DSM 44199]
MLSGTPVALVSTVIGDDRGLFTSGGPGGGGSRAAGCGAGRPG